MNTELTPAQLQAARLVNDLALAGMTLVFVDYLHTLPEEIRLVWPTTMSIPKLVFFAVRYGSFVLAILVYICDITQTFSAKDCEIILTVIGALEVTLSSLGEVVIYIRVWAFSGCAKTVLYFLVAHYLIMTGTAFGTLSKFASSVKATSAAPLTGFSCVQYDGENIFVSMSFLTLLISLISLMGFMIVIAVHKHRAAPISGARSGLLVQFYRDRLMYFVVLGAFCIVNIVVSAVGRNGHQYSMVELQIYVHNVIATRMILHLRAYCEADARSGHEVTETGQSQSVYSGPHGDLRGVKHGEIWKVLVPSFHERRRETVELVSTVKFASVGEGGVGE